VEPNFTQQSREKKSVKCVAEKPHKKISGRRGETRSPELTNLGILMKRSPPGVKMRKKRCTLPPKKNVRGPKDEK